MKKSISYTIILALVMLVGVVGMILLYNIGVSSSASQNSPEAYEEQSEITYITYEKMYTKNEVLTTGIYYEMQYGFLQKLKQYHPDALVDVHIMEERARSFDYKLSVRIPNEDKNVIFSERELEIISDAIVGHGELSIVANYNTPEEKIIIANSDVIFHSLSTEALEDAVIYQCLLQLKDSGYEKYKSLLDESTADKVKLHILLDGTVVGETEIKTEYQSEEELYQFYYQFYSKEDMLRYKCVDYD